MKPRVYIETTVISYLVPRSMRDVIQVARQQLTRAWWDQRAEDFDLVVSQLVINEAARGDQRYARKRLELLNDLPLLSATPESEDWANRILASRVFPPQATADVAHLALATAHGVDFLLTWNCKHLANPLLLRQVGRMIRAAGLEPPIVCTPEELMGETL